MKFLLLRKLLLSILLIMAVHIGIDHLLQKFALHTGLLPLALNLVTFAAIWLVFQFHSRSIQQVVETLEIGVKCFEDNDFSITIQNKRNDELGRIIDAYNNVAQTIRAERMSLHQREVLLDTIIQETPVALILTDGSGIVVYSNDATKTLFGLTEKPDELVFATLIKGLPEALKKATQEKRPGLYTHQDSQHKKVYYLNCQHFNINGAEHFLYLYKNMTSEISRQEIDLWKNAIRLMSHELNNSLAPITSLTNSAKDILSKPQHMDMLPDILDTISQRTTRLHTFIEQYARFARLPSPTIRPVEVSDFVATIIKLCECRLIGKAPKIKLKIDQGQMEQVLINLVKNGKESGGPVEEVSLKVKHDGNTVTFSVCDRGPGMSEQQLQQALLPFFSTKQQGTGLGLTLCNEIVTVHGGTIRIANREEAGLEVKVVLPVESISH